MAAAMTFAFTVPCLPTEHMQQEKFGEAYYTCVLESLDGGREEGGILYESKCWHPRKWQTVYRCPSSGVNVLEHILAHNLVYFEDYVVLASCFWVKHHWNSDIQLKSKIKI